MNIPFEVLVNDVYDIETLDDFDKYILNYFYQGVRYSNEG